MAMPLFSKQMSIVVDGSILGCATDFSLSVDRDLIEVACLSDTTGFKQSVPDLVGWSMSFSGLVMQEASVDSGRASFYDLMDNLIGNTDASVGVYILPDVSANTYWTGAGYIASLSMDGGVGSAVTFSGEVTGTGALVGTTTV